MIRTAELHKDVIDNSSGKVAIPICLPSDREMSPNIMDDMIYENDDF